MWSAGLRFDTIYRPLSEFFSLHLSAKNPSVNSSYDYESGLLSGTVSSIVALPCLGTVYSFLAHSYKVFMRFQISIGPNCHRYVLLSAETQSMHTVHDSLIKSFLISDYTWQCNTCVTFALMSLSVRFPLSSVSQPMSANATHSVVFILICVCLNI